MKRYTFYLLLTLMLFACENNGDDKPTLEFTQEQLQFMHGGSEKIWRITQLVREASRSRLSQLMPCHVDDPYTFKSGSGDVEVTLGDESCFWQDPDRELSEVVYLYSEETGELFLEHARGEEKDSEFSQISYVLKLRELSETRMLFASGTPNNYGRVMIFEVVE